MFITEYLKNPRFIGAVAPSGKYLARKMIEGIDFERADLIVEYGPGTGVFSRAIIARKKEETALLLVERNESFYERLRDEFRDSPNVFVSLGDAQDVDALLQERGLPSSPDYVLSGLPFASLPEDVSTKILEKTRAALKENGRFVTFQYALFKKSLFERFFIVEKITREFRNLPPAYVLTMRRRDGVENA